MITTTDAREILQVILNNDRLYNFLLDIGTLSKNDSVQHNFLVVLEDNTSILDTIISEKISVLKANETFMAELVDNIILENPDPDEYDDICTFLYSELPIDIQQAVMSIAVEFIYTVKYSFVDNFFLQNWHYFVCKWDEILLKSKPKVKLLIEALMVQMDKLAAFIDDMHKIPDIDKCPDNLLDYIAANLGFIRADYALDNAVFREVIKNILEIYTIKGSVYSFELFFRFLGFNCYVYEYFFDRRKFFQGAGISGGELETTNKFLFKYYLTAENPILNIVDVVDNWNTLLVCDEPDIQDTQDLDDFNYYASKYFETDVQLFTLLGYYFDYTEVEITGFPKIYDLSELDKVRKQYGKSYLPTENDVIRNILHWERQTDGTIRDLKNLKEVDYFKYFRTNYVNFKLKPFTYGLSAEMSKIILDYLKFLIPSYIRNEIIVEGAHVTDKFFADLKNTAPMINVTYLDFQKIQNLRHSYEVQLDVAIPSTELCQDADPYPLKLNHTWGLGYPETSYAYASSIISYMDYPNAYYNPLDGNNRYQPGSKKMYPDNYLIESVDRLKINRYYYSIRNRFIDNIEWETFDV